MGFHLEILSQDEWVDVHSIDPPYLDLQLNLLVLKLYTSSQDLLDLG